MQKYKSNITTTSGSAVRNVPVTVIKEDGALASLFLDRAGNVDAPNPVTTGNDGTFSFYAANGRYSLRTDSAGANVLEEDVILLNDPVERYEGLATDSELRDRATHTGEQAISTVTGLQDEIDAKDTATQVHAATAKTTPSDADELGYLDSASSFSLVKITWANLKAWLSSLFVSKTGAVMTGNLTVPSLNGGQLAGMRNRIINGNFMINQTGFTGTNVLGEYGPDCFSLGGSLSGATVGMSLYSDNGVSATGTSHVLLATTAAKASLSASDVVVLEHRIEGLNIADLKWGTPSAKTINLSFRCVLTGVSSGVISVALRNGDGSRSYVTTIDATNTPGTYSVTIPGDSSGTWPTNNSTGIHITWTHCCGSKYSTSTTGAWQSGNFVAATTQANLLTTAGNGFAVTDIQCEVGTVATPFEQRAHGAELALCQRYYEEGHFEMRCYSQYGTSNRVSFAVGKRAAPTLTMSTVDFFGTGAVGAYADAPSIDSFRAGADWTSTLAWRAVGFYWQASARL